jgi:Zn-dependent alcohol dehydrogenase
VYVKVDEEIISVDPVPMMQSTATISNGKDSITATAIVGVDLNQKGMQTSQQFGAASTYGKKYALGNLFLIDDTEDADATNNHSTTTTVTKKKITDAQMKKAVEFVSGGGDIKAILSKYTLTPAQLTELKKLTK